MRSEKRLTRGLFTLGFAVLMAATAVQWGAAQGGGIITNDLTGPLTPADLVAALVGTTNAPTVSNIAFIGDERGGGTFSGGTTTVGFGSGIILGSGNIGSVVGPNNSGSTSTSFNTPGDPDLNALIPGFTTQDATILEFDFQCSASQVVSFRYVFSSEEYNEFVNSKYNDVFGFYLNGKNIALLPQSTTPVAINNVNGGNPIGTNASHPELFRNNAGGTIDIEPDGLTVVLGAEAKINSGLNHIKLAIADAGDTIYDSWVFLQQGSFQCGALKRTAGDFDGDGKADVTVFRPSNGTWYGLQSSTNYTTATGVQWGNGFDKPVPADYDGDGKADIAVFRPSNGTWYLLYSSTGTAAAFQWGNASDVPVAGDYNGDGLADIAVFRPSNGTWYVRYSGTGGTAGFQWGNGSDVPVPADYNGDGLTDIAVFRPSNGTWYLRYSGTGATAGFQWGNGSDVPVPADYNGDGRADIAVFRPSNGTWYLLYSGTGTTAGIQWGNGSDVPVAGDYNGDGRTDLAVFRPSNGTWYLLYSGTGTTAGIQWGNGSDIPILKRP